MDDTDDIYVMDDTDEITDTDAILYIYIELHQYQ